MIKDLFDIYIKCFPNDDISIDEFNEKLDINDAYLLCNFDEKFRLNGFVLIRENCIGLICVDPKDQRKGFGTRLLKKAERLIYDNGYQDIVLGYKKGEEGIIKGRPCSNEANNAFFLHNSYKVQSYLYDVDIDIPKNDYEKYISYDIDNTSKSLEERAIFFKIIKDYDMDIYNKYVNDEEVNIMYARIGTRIYGVCAYYIKDAIEIQELKTYPSDNVYIKNILLSSIKDIQVKHNISKITINEVTNPIMYEKDYNGKVKKKYLKLNKTLRP